MSRHAAWSLLLLLAVSINFVHATFNGSFNPLIDPSSDECILPGAPFTVSWDVTTSGLVSLLLRVSGASNGTVIANSIQASAGQFLWNVPKSLNESASDLLNDPYMYELRIYEGSLEPVGSVVEITNFSSRQFDWSSGYFAISDQDPLDFGIGGNDGFTVSFGDFGPTTEPIPPKNPKTPTAGVTPTQAVGSVEVTGDYATRLPTFLAVDHLSVGERVRSANVLGIILLIFGALMGGLLL